MCGVKEEMLLPRWEAAVLQGHCHSQRGKSIPTASPVERSLHSYFIDPTKVSAETMMVLKEVVVLHEQLNFGFSQPAEKVTEGLFSSRRHMENPRNVQSVATPTERILQEKALGLPGFRLGACCRLGACHQT